MPEITIRISVPNGAKVSVEGAKDSCKVAGTCCAPTPEKERHGESANPSKCPYSCTKQPKKYQRWHNLKRTIGRPPTEEEMEHYDGRKHTPKDEHGAPQLCQECIEDIPDGKAIYDEKMMPYCSKSCMKKAKEE